MHDVATTLAKSRRRPQPDVFTTCQIARICSVAPRTVSKWIDAGNLRGYRIPGSKHRRVPQSELIRFMREHGMPLNGFYNGLTSILIVDQYPDDIVVLREQCGKQLDIAATSSTGGAVLLIERNHPCVIFIDGNYKGVAAELFCLVKDHPELRPISIFEIRRPGILWDFALDGYVDHPLDRIKIENVLIGLGVL